MTTIASILVVTVMCMFLFRKGRRASILAYLAAFFAFFAFGPVVNSLIGNSIYKGTIGSLVPEATVGFTVAVAMWLVVDIAFPEGIDMAQARRRFMAPPNRYPSLTYLLWALAAYGFLMTIRIVAIGTTGKLDAIQGAGPFHYQYLLLQLCVTSTAFLAWRDVSTRHAFNANLVCYFCYCLTTSERDFIFVAFSLLLHGVALGHIRRSGWLPVAAASLAGMGTLLFTLRQSVGVGLSQLLNQGSLLFVDTYVLYLLPNLPSSETESYSRLLYKSSAEHQSLSQWFVANYAPGSKSGFGFSLTAEARMNFGLLGVAILFLALGLVHRWTLQRAARQDWALVFSPLFVTQLMYAFRGDLRSLIWGIGYGMTVFFLVWLTSKRTLACVTSSSPKTARPLTRLHSPGHQSEPCQ